MAAPFIRFDELTACFDGLIVRGFAFVLRQARPELAEGLSMNGV